MYFLKDFLFVIVILGDYVYEIVVLNSNNIYIYKKKNLYLSKHLTLFP